MAVVFFLLLSEIPGFLSEEECRVVVQLAQLKGLMESQITAPNQGQEESNQQLLSLSTEEVFSLLDLNQDRLLQKQEVTRDIHMWHRCGKKLVCKKMRNMSEYVVEKLEYIFSCLLQIVSHSRSQDGTWLSPDSLRQILTGLETCPTGLCSCHLCVLCNLFLYEELKLTWNGVTLVMLTKVQFYLFVWFKKSSTVSSNVLNTIYFTMLLLGCLWVFLLWSFTGKVAVIACKSMTVEAGRVATPFWPGAIVPAIVHVRVRMCLILSH